MSNKNIRFALSSKKLQTMKKIIAFCLLLVIAVVARADINKPDFAYPRQVVKDANIALAESEKSGDGIGVLQALMQISVANYSIDRDSLQYSAKEVLKLAKKQKDRQVKSLFDLYAATLINKVYSQRSYVYASRKLPLSPRPEDMTEWSGEMFKTVIDSLCEVAWANAGDMPISELTRIVDADDICQRYYPTLADFVASEIIDVNKTISASRKDAILSLHKEPSAPWYNWKIRLNKSDLDLAGLLQLYKSAPAEYKSNASIAFQYIKDNYTNIEQIDRQYGISKYIAALTEAQKELKGTWAEDIVAHLMNLATNPSLTLNVNALVAANEPFDLRLSNMRNVETLTIKVIKSELIIDTKEFAINHKSPEKGDTILQMQLPLGNYELKAFISSDQISTYKVYSARAIPVALSAQNMNAVHVIDIKTGESLPNIPVTVKSNKKPIATAVTNFQGIATFSEPIAGSVSLKIDGVTQDFTGLIYLEKLRNSSAQNAKQNYSYSLTTDMPIYKPGDTVNWAGIITANGQVQPQVMQAMELISYVSDEVISNDTFTSDEFGRISGQFKIPEDVKLGTYAISTNNKASSNNLVRFEVSDFKPETMRFDKFTVWPQTTEKQEGADKHKGTAVISGVVLNYANFGVDNATVECVVTTNEPTKAQGKTDVNGAFEIAVPYSYNDDTDQAQVECNVIASDGTTISKTKWFSAAYPYKICINNKITKTAYDINDSVVVSVDILDPNSKKLALPVRWSLIANSDSIVASGTSEDPNNIVMKLSDIKAGEYSFKFSLLETGLAADAEIYYIYLYDSTKKELPTSDLIWVKPTDTIDYNKEGKTVSFTIGVREDNTIIYTYADLAEAKYNKQIFSSGYHTLTVNLSDIKLLGERLRMYAVHNCETWTNSFYLPEKPDNELKFSTESFRDKIYADTPEQWHFRITDNAGNSITSAMVLTMYDKRLDLFTNRAKSSLRLYTPKSSNGSLLLSFLQQRSILHSVNKPYTSKVFNELTAPIWQYKGEWGYTRGSRKLKASSVKAELAVADLASTEATTMLSSASFGAQYLAVESEVSDEDVADSGSDVTNTADFDNITLRNTDNYLAFWKPDLNSDKNGEYDISFITPNSNTTWQLQGFAWTKDCKNVQISHEFVAAKPIMVSTNMPRFVRSDDRAIIGATVMNNSDTEQHIKLLLQIDADTISGSPIAQQIVKKTLKAGQSDVEFITLDAGKSDLINSGKAYITAKVSNGTFSDGERVSISVLPSQTLVVDSENFYLNPGEKTYSTDIAHPEGRDISSTLTFTENAMWTVVESLPLLTSDDNLWNCLSCQSSAFFASSVALGLQKEHSELELQFDIKDMQKVQKSTLQFLIDMQLDNGAWRWCKWDTSGSIFTTSKILSYLAILKRSGYLPNNHELNKMIEKALKFYDSKAQNIDLQYTIFRSAFPEVMQSLNGNKVSDATVQWINKNWKGLDISTKALAATALQYTNNKNMAKKLISSLDEFGTQTKNKGFEFMNVRDLASYAKLLHAYSSIVPNSEHVDGLRQYLIVNKQATNWGNYTTTSDIVAAMINSGTKWTVPARGATVSVDGTKLDVQGKGRMGTLTTDVTGQHLEIAVNGDTPAYGAVITRYNAPMKEVKSYSDGEISIEKTIYVLRNNKWENIDSLRVGDKVKISLTVKASRPFNELIITDDRAATFMPKEQLAKFTFTGGIFAYRENRNAVTNLYLSYLPKGTHVIDYEMTVNNAGEFASGLATVTCVQAPELTAHSSGTRLKVLPQN